MNAPNSLDKETFAKHTFHKFQNLLNKNLKEETEVAERIKLDEALIFKMKQSAIDSEPKEVEPEG